MTTTDTSADTYLSFMIDNEFFAVTVGKVLEVLQKQKITRVPNVTDDIVGVTNFRGDIIPVFETRTRFGLPNRGAQDKHVIIVIEITVNNSTSTIGAMADKVKDVITIEKKDILEVPKMSNKIKEELISGIYKQHDDYIMLLDVDKMFSEQEVQAISEIS